MSDERALLKTIRDNPQHTDAQLVYADWLCENGCDQEGIALRVRTQPDVDEWRLQYAAWLESLSVMAVLCPKCKGTKKRHVNIPVGVISSGEHPTERWEVLCECETGFVPDTSNHRRAELILVQCELASLGSPVPHTDEVHGLAVREHEILAANADRWRRGPKCETCEGKKRVGPNPPPTTLYYDCRDCHGTGDAGGLMRKLMKGQHDSSNGHVPVVTYHRGMKRVECRAADVWEEVLCTSCDGVGEDARDGQGECPICKGSGSSGWSPTAWVSAVCKHHLDVVELWVTDIDRTPRKEQEGLGFSLLWTSLPPDVCTMFRTTGVDSYHPTEDAARVALSRVVVQWVWSHLKG